MTTTTVVTSQPGANTTIVLSSGNEEWTSGLFDCFEDTCSCLGAFCCAGFFECYLADYANEFPCLPLCVPGSSIALRTKLRTLYGLKGSICNDCLMLTLCNPCALAQMKREIDNRGGRR